MKLRKSILVTAALVSAFAISGTVQADRGGGHVGVYGGGHYGGGHFGGGYHGYGNAGAFIGGTIVAGALLAPWYYPGPYYYPSYPTVVEVAPPAPTVYIEQPGAAQAAATDAGSWWYFCNDSKAYYPYVRECASPWQRVSPTPSASR